MNKLNPGERLAFSRSQRKLKKKIAKAIRQHKKRSHLRKELQEQWQAFWGKIFGAGPIGTMLAYTMHRRRKTFRGAVVNNTPLLDKMRSMGTLSFVSGGRLIGEKNER